MGFIAAIARVLWDFGPPLAYCRCCQVIAWMIRVYAKNYYCM